MATTIVQHHQMKYQNHTNDENNNDENIEILLATVTVVLGACTAVLGLSLILIGRLRLAQYVQLLPTR